MIGLYCSCVVVTDVSSIPPNETAFYVFALVSVLQAHGDALLLLNDISVHLRGRKEVVQDVLLPDQQQYPGKEPIDRDLRVKPTN